jgi:hypothetical protein
MDFLCVAIELHFLDLFRIFIRGTFALCAITIDVQRLTAQRGGDGSWNTCFVVVIWSLIRAKEVGETK